MPNHVHVVAEMLAGHSMSNIVKSWKSFISRQANAHLGRTGTFWEPDYFDRYMRNEDHLVRTIEYVENNPVKAGLVCKPPPGPGVRQGWSADLQVRIIS